MYGRSQQPYRWHVPHVNDRAQRMGRFSYSRYVSSHSTSSLIAYISCIIISCILGSRQQPAPKVSIYLLLWLQCLTSLLFLSAAQTSPFHSAKRRRLYGLNSRFDRMLQEVSWASNYTKVSRPRHKRTNSPSSSSMTNHDLPKTPTDSLNELGHVSGKIQKRFPSAMETGNQVYFHFLWAPMSN